MDLIKQLEEFLNEDNSQNDITTLTVLSALGKDPVYEFHLVSRWDGVFSGRAWLNLFSERFSNSAFVWSLLPEEGAEIEKGKVFASGKAPVSLILSLERTLLNGLQYFCGIASEAKRFSLRVDAIAREKDIPTPLLLHTRKILPGLRPYIMQALQSGGIAKHRETLSDRFLLKDNHRELLAAGGMSLKSFLAKVPKNVLKDGLFEADSEIEAQTFIEEGVQHLLLDNFTPSRLGDFLPTLPKNVSIEVSGGIRFENLADFIIPGVHRISVGALTHSTRSLDISLDLGSQCS